MENMISTSEGGHVTMEVLNRVTNAGLISKVDDGKRLDPTSSVLIFFILRKLKRKTTI
jgi:ribosomal protein S19E (S16A)